MHIISSSSNFAIQVLFYDYFTFRVKKSVQLIFSIEFSRENICTFILFMIVLFFPFFKILFECVALIV